MEGLNKSCAQRMVMRPASTIAEISGAMEVVAWVARLANRSLYCERAMPSDVSRILLF